MSLACRSVFATRSMSHRNVSKVTTRQPGLAAAVVSRTNELLQRINLAVRELRPEEEGPGVVMTAPGPSRAGDRIRTDDVQLGKLAFYR